MSNNTSKSTELLFNRFLLFIVASLFAASIYGYYHFSDMHIVVRVLGLLFGFAASVGVLLMTVQGKSGFNYLSAVKKEVLQVVWPTRSETIQMTLMVFVMVVIMGIFIWLVDMFFLWGVKLLTGQGG